MNVKKRIRQAAARRFLTPDQWLEQLAREHFERLDARKAKRQQQRRQARALRGAGQPLVDVFK